MLKTIDCGYSLEPPRLKKYRLWVVVELPQRGGSNLCFEQKYENIRMFTRQFHFLVKFSEYLSRFVFVMRALREDLGPSLQSFSS